MRRLLTWSSGLTAAFVVLIALIHAQPERRPALEALLVPPPGCRMPCFIGIRLGDTSAQQAVDTLRAHPFVGDVQIVGAGDRRLSSVRWQWSADAPPGIAGFRDNTLEVNRDTVTGITLHVFAPTGDVWRVLTTHTDSTGRPLADYIRIDGPNCIASPLSYYRAAPERVFYSTRPASPRPPWQPLAARPSRALCRP